MMRRESYGYDEVQRRTRSFDETLSNERHLEDQQRAQHSTPTVTLTTINDSSRAHYQTAYTNSTVISRSCKQSTVADNFKLDN